MDGGIDWERSDEFSICSDYNCSCPDSSMRARAGTVEGGRGRTYRMVLMWQLPHTLWHNYRKNEWLQGCNQNSCHFYNVRQCWALPWGLLLSRGIASGWIAMMWLSNDGEGRKERNECVKRTEKDCYSSHACRSWGKWILLSLTYKMHNCQWRQWQNQGSPFLSFPFYNSQLCIQLEFQWLVWI